MNTGSDEIRFLSPTAILGYGYPLASLNAGLDQKPHFIGVDAGSTDPGPYYLGEGVSFTTAQGVRRDLEPLLRAGQFLRIPVIVGSSGGAGGDPHLEWLWAILREIARDEGMSMRVALIHSEQNPATIREALRQGRLTPLGPVPPATEAAIKRSTRIVAQMGVEPIQAALELDVDVVLAGRSCDVSIFAALPLARGFDPGLAIHAAKIVECGAYCAEPAGASDGILAVIDRERFVLRALNPSRRITATSAAAHSLYEQNHPWLIVEPGGSVDVSSASFSSMDDGSVEVSGSRFEPAPQYTLKLEAAARVGYRAVMIAGIRDPVAIRYVDASFAAARDRVNETFAAHLASIRLSLRVYGRDGVMGLREPMQVPSHEVGLVIEVIAETQDLAIEACALARSTMLHHDYPHRVAVGGNLALPFSPHEGSWGPAYEFSLYHLMATDDPLRAFPIEVRQT